MIREGQSRDVKRYEALRSLGCIACHLIGAPGRIAEVHHLVDKGYRKHSGGNQATIPLCSYHHRGVPHEGISLHHMRVMYGPSMFLESKEFAKEFGSQRALLARVNEMIGATGGKRGIADG